LCCSIEIDVRTCRSQSDHLLFDAFVLQLVLVLRAARCLRRVDQCPQVSKGTVSNLSLRFLEDAADNKQQKIGKSKSVLIGVNIPRRDSTNFVTPVTQSDGCSHPYLVKVSAQGGRQGVPFGSD
jgi:hypothetical protein